MSFFLLFPVYGQSKKHYRQPVDKYSLWQVSPVKRNLQSTASSPNFASGWFESSYGSTIDQPLQKRAKHVWQRFESGANLYILFSK